MGLASIYQSEGDHFLQGDSILWMEEQFKNWHPPEKIAFFLYFKVEQMLEIFIFKFVRSSGLYADLSQSV